MISPLSATKLAYTKLKTRRLRLAISLIIVSLLFSILIAATLIQAGFFASFNKFSSEGLAGRYIVAGYGTPITWGETGLMQNPAVIGRAESLQNQLREKKAAKAEELGIEYKPEWDTAVRIQPDGSKFLITGSAISKQAVAEYREKLKRADMTSFRQQLQELDIVATYRSVQRQHEEGKLLYIKDGKEPTAAELADWQQMAQGFSGFTQSDWQLMDDELLSSFVFEGQTLEIGEDGSIPLVAPSYAIEQELGLEPQPADASPAEKRERLELLRREAASMTFEICYRNASSLDLFNKAVSQQSDKTANSDKEDYETPDLLYNLPEVACQESVVESDTRDDAQKEIDTKWLEFDKAFAKPEPFSQMMRFRVVGIKKDFNPRIQSQDGSNFTPEQIFDTAFNSTAGSGWLSPMSAQSGNQTIENLFRQDPGESIGEMVTYYAEFTNGEAAKRALIEMSCTPSYGTEEKGLLGTKLEKNERVPVCSRDGRQFTLQPFGSNAIAIDQFKSLTQRILFIVAVAVAALTALVLMSMVGRIIADSRKETAIFRAVGATRLSIMQVYFTYTGFLVLWIVGLSILFGSVAAYFFNNMFSPDFSIAAAVAFSVKDLTQEFTFIGINWANLGLIVLVVAAASFLAAIIPILRNVRRNPMADMREE